MLRTIHVSWCALQAALLNAYESQSVANTSGTNPDCVLMIYGMEPAKFNCHRLFNLLCIYGTVIRVHRSSYSFGVIARLFSARLLITSMK